MDLDLIKALIGTVETGYELHSFHGDTWLLVKESKNHRELERLAGLLIQRNEVDGIRLARRTDYKDHGFSTAIVVAKRLRDGVQEPDPLARANPGRDAGWCETPDDLLGDVQRQVLRTFLGRYLDDRRLTPLELLSYEVPAKALDGAGTALQGALQRIASAQVRGTKQTAAARMKELIGIVEAGMAGLSDQARLGPPLPIPPGGLPALADALGKGAAGERALFRALAAHLAEAKTWVDKLDRLFRLWRPTLAMREMRALDSLAAEILASPLALKELAGGHRDRLGLVINAVDLYAGHLGGGSDRALPAGVKCLSTLLSAGVLPRTLAELRLGLLRHLHARLPLQGTGGMREEMRATATVLDHLRRHAPVLARDEEVVEALAARADRLIQPEAVADLLASARTMLARIDNLLQLVEEAPGEGPAIKLIPYLRPLIAPEDIIREQPSRLEAIKTLTGLARRIAQSGLPATAKPEMLDILDSALFDGIRSEILGNPGLTFTDRILAIVRLCAGLPEGRARQLASDQLAQALRRPEFILTYLERFSGAPERREAYFKLCTALLDSGLVDKSLVPLAA